MAESVYPPGMSEKSRIGILPQAPTLDRVTEYDAAQMLTYARLLDAGREGHSWQAAAREILLLEIEMDPEAAQSCWQSHFERAQWVISDGLLKSVEDLSARSAGR